MSLILYDKTLVKSTIQNISLKRYTGENDFIAISYLKTYLRFLNYALVRMRNEDDTVNGQYSKAAMQLSVTMNNILEEPIIITPEEPVELPFVPIVRYAFTNTNAFSFFNSLTFTDVDGNNLPYTTTIDDEAVNAPSFFTTGIIVFDTPLASPDITVSLFDSFGGFPELTINGVFSLSQGFGTSHVVNVTQEMYIDETITISIHADS